jgi:hypothetical protein
VDGCGNLSYYQEGYRAMGQALQASGRDIVFSCSWPAYIGANETIKPFAEFISDGGWAASSFPCCLSRTQPT